MEQTYFPQGTGNDSIAMALGHPALEALPWEDLRQSATRALTAPQAYQALQYGDDWGVPELVTYLVNRINRTEAISISPKNLMITAGATSAVEIIARLFAHRTGVVLVEAPSYRDALHVFRDQSLRLISVGMDDHGVLIDALRAVLEELQSAGTPPSVFYTIPNFHNPTGVTTSLERRQAIIELCKAFGVLILEDDVYHDLAFSGHVPPSYYALAGGQGVGSVGSFSKTLAPGLRLGWMVAPEAVIETCVSSGSIQMGGGANPLVATLLADYCQQGLWESHIERLRDLYQKRCAAMLESLAAHMPPSVSWTRPEGGFFIWLTLPEPLDVDALQSRARQAGILIVPGHRFFVESGDQTCHIRLAFSYTDTELIPTGIARLAGVVNGLLT